MKRLSYLLCLLGILLQSAAFAQIPVADASITGEGPKATIGGQTTYEGVGHTGNFLINVVNLGPGTIPAGGMLVAAAVSPNLAFTYPLPPSAVPAGWEIFAADSSNVQLTNTVSIPAGEIYTFSYPLKAVQAGPGTYLFDVSNLGYNDPVPTNNSSPVGTTVTSVGNKPLPVTLASFSVVKEGTASDLNWVTTEEVNSDYFEIQHSLDAKQWVVLGTVESHKDSKNRNQYNYKHQAPAPGLNYYRLRMVDRDLTYGYSSIRSVAIEERAAPELVRIYPNPVNVGQQLNVETASTQRVRYIELLNSNGTRVYTSSAGKTPVNVIPVSAYPAGLYITRVIYENGSHSTHKVILSR